MGAVATFDYETWLASYPAFSNVDAVQAQIFWTEATIYWRNDGSGPVQDPAVQAVLLNMITAHIAFLRVGTTGNPSAASQGLVGRISSASQGSVSVSTDAAGLPGTAVWFSSSPYGLNFWQATAAYRLGRYRPSPGRFGY
jgi:hypothetical protein